MAEMSKAVEVVYGVLFDEMKFAKRQQWTVTNYMLLLLGQSSESAPRSSH